jgi:hypothetical protein
MEIFPPVKVDCPKSYDVSVSISGSGSIHIPESDPLTGDKPCVMTFSTPPPGFKGNYYSEAIGLGYAGN